MAEHRVRHEPKSMKKTECQGLAQQQSQGHPEGDRMGHRGNQISQLQHQTGVCKGEDRYDAENQPVVQLVLHARVGPTRHS